MKAPLFMVILSVPAKNLVVSARREQMFRGYAQHEKIAVADHVPHYRV